MVEVLKCTSGSAVYSHVADLLPTQGGGTTAAREQRQCVVYLDSQYSLQLGESFEMAATLPDSLFEKKLQSSECINATVMIVIRYSGQMF